MIVLAAWVVTLPLRIAWQLGVRRSLILVCLLVLVVCVDGVAGDLGLGDPPAQARGRPGGQAAPSRAAIADIPPNYLRRYRSAPGRLDRALFAYNHSWSYVARVKQVARRYVAGGGGRR